MNPSDDGKREMFYVGRFYTQFVVHLYRSASISEVALYAIVIDMTVVLPLEIAGQTPLRRTINSTGYYSFVGRL